MPNQMDQERFRNPPMDCRAAPFWSWNGELDTEETRRQVRELAEKGMGGGFMHSRVGLRTEYFGEGWFANCAAVIDEGSKAGFRAWLYDEDRWPSGFCAGATAAENPDFRGRCVLMQPGDDPPQVPRQFWLGMRTSPEQMTCLAKVRLIRKPGGETEFRRAEMNESGPEILSFYETVLPGWTYCNGEHYPDLLNQEAVAEFIRNTYEVYAARFQDHFGNAIPGIFTDEPTLLGGVPWSVKLQSQFSDRRGYDLVPRIHLLFVPGPCAAEVRHDFWKTVHELYNQSYMAQLGKWCAQHGIALTGHVNCEQDLWSQIHSNGGCMEHYLHMQIPGIDILRERITEVATCKQASSICHQFEKPLMLSETYGCNGYNFSFEGQKWIGDWQMALGVNFLCQHLTLYTMKGCAKRDYPPSYGYQSPWWRHYRHMADYQARLSYVLRQGHPLRDILLIHPLTGAWCSFDPTVGRDNGFGLLEENRLFDDAMAQLLGIHRDFDLGDEMVMANHARIDGQEIFVGKARYKLVVVPPTCNLESSTMDLLEEYVKVGGKLIFAGEIPSLIDGQPSERVLKVAQSQGVHRTGPNKSLEAILAEILPRRVSVLHAETLKEAETVLCQQRKLDDGYLFFLANTDRDAAVPLKLSVPIPGVWQQWHCETGEVAKLHAADTATSSLVELYLAPVGSAVLHLNPNEPPRPRTETPAVAVTKTIIKHCDGWPFRRLAPNSLILDRCRYQINDDEFSAEAFLNDAQEEWRSRFGLSSVRRMNADIQPWKRLQDPDNLEPRARLALRYSFQVNDLPAQETFLVLEDRDGFEILINGSPVDAPTAGWFMDKSFEKVAIGKFIKPGKNMVELRTTLTAMCVIEDIYIIGDFGVSPETFALIFEPEQLATGDWCPQGYPFYTDGMVYEARFEIKEGFRGRVAVEIERFEGTVAAVWVNGKHAAVLGWRPYRADVTDYARPGSNTLGIEIVGSARNLMGPRHSAERYPVFTSSNELLDTSEPGYHITPAGLMGDVTIVCHEEQV